MANDPIKPNNEVTSLGTSRSKKSTNSLDSADRANICEMANPCRCCLKTTDTAKLL
jgi:hypothetical protein